MKSAINMDTQIVALTKVDNGLEATPTVGLTPNESYVNQEEVDCNILLADAAAELNMSKTEVKTLVQKEKIQSELKDGYYYVNVGEIQTYFSELDGISDTPETDDISNDTFNFVVRKTEQEKAELLNKFSLDISDIGSKLKSVSSSKPVNSASNYTGGKEELFAQISPYLKSDIATFHDVCGGGGIMSLNVEAEISVYNEYYPDMSNLMYNLTQNSVEENYKAVEGVINEYNLSIDNEEAYYLLRDKFNTSTEKPWAMFYCLILHSYKNMISYNTKEEFNKSFGVRDFNSSLRPKFILFTDMLIANSHRMRFQSGSYNYIDNHKFQENDFVYVDPPYYASNNKYGVKWKDEEEKALLKSLDSLNDRGVNFALSNFIHDNGKTNQILIDWAEQNSDYNVIYLNKSYEDQKRNKVDGAITVEVLITNYKTLNSQEVHEITMMDTEIIQGRFVHNSNTVENIKKHFNNAEEHAQAYVASMNNALREKCAELIGRIKTGQGLIVFFAECKRDGKVLKEEVQKEFLFSYETARGYVNLAKNPRIAVLKIDDIMSFERKSLDALKDIAALTDVEYELFRNGEFELPKTRKIASSRQNPSSAENDEVLEVNVSTTLDSAEMVSEVANNSNIVEETEFINPTTLSDEHYKEILAFDEVELQKQHIQLASAEYLILNNSGKSGFPFVMAS